MANRRLSSGMRRPRGFGGAVPSPDFPRPVGASALWDSTRGVTLSSGVVSQWTDLIGGRVVSQSTAGLRPAYGVDGGSATSRVGVQTSSSGGTYLSGLGVDQLANTGDYAYMGLITRQRVKATTGIQAHVTIDGDNTFALRTAFALSARGDGAGVESWYCHRNSAGNGCDFQSGDTQDTLTHFWEWVLDPSTGTSYYLDGNLLANVNSTAAKAGLASPQFNVQISQNGYVSDATFYIVVHSPSQPSAAERTAMLAWARRYCGVA